MTSSEHYRIRSELVKELRRELMGPHIDIEGLAVINERPSWRYITGILYPAGLLVDDEETDEIGVGEESSEEDTVPVGNYNFKAMFKPSSFGLTFVIHEKDLEDFELEYNFGVYVPLKEEIHTDVANESQKIKSSPNLFYQLIRIQANIELGGYKDDIIADLNDINVEFNHKILDEIPPSYTPDQIEEFIKIRCAMMVQKNPEDKHDLLLINISITNKHADKRGETYNLLHNSLRVKSVSEKSYFQDRRKWYSKSILDYEEAKMQFINRHILDYAVGNGVAAVWDSKSEKVNEIWTEFIPTVEVPKAIPNPKSRPSNNILKMSKLSSVTLNPVEISELLVGYIQWYEKLKSEVDNFIEGEKITAIRITNDIKAVISRIKSGIALLTKNTEALKAFQLMNQALFLTRKNINSEEDPEWRPFQLGFILYALESLLNPESKDRDIMDLLWFPTGGGKTEAYLGLVGIILVYRRLKYGDNGAGTAVISRYTLRLLTLQQYRRASSLICALEFLRSEHQGLGSQEFSIGLWVGNNATPGTIKEASKSLASNDSGPTVIQFNSCPWCGWDLDDRKSYIQFKEFESHTNPKILCLNSDCKFKTGLPVYLVDEQIYQYLPSIVIGTVDKFARLPMVKESGGILGASNDKLPVDMIIQDELHLIDGPLGTIYGIYEMMLNGIIARLDRSRLPKMIASTATIRRANEHIKTLYSRESTIFPPVGYEANNTYWSIIDSTDSDATRMYMGIFSPGKSSKTSFVRMQSLILVKIKKLLEDGATKEIIDPYWTLVGYFNSLRELGGAMMLIKDDILTRIKSLSNEINLKQHRKIPNPKELTSRLSSKEVAEMLDSLENNLMSTENVLDTVYATNMLSVGVDIDRLSLMHVVGQPKRTSEYIQASARVGRKFPGLVTTQYRWSMPRDRSHYEKFLYYHLTMDTLVDVLSATPFSPPSIQRCLHAAIIGLVRHTFNGYLSESSASKFDSNQSKTEVDSLLEFVENWIVNMDRYTPVEIQNILGSISELLNEWEALNRQTSRKTRYYRRKAGHENLMIDMTAQERDSFFPKRTPSSMRNVEDHAQYWVRRAIDRRLE